MRDQETLGDTDGALLCNFTATTFKLNLQDLAADETIEYRMSHTELPDLEVRREC